MRGFEQRNTCSIVEPTDYLFAKDISGVWDGKIGDSSVEGAIIDGIIDLSHVVIEDDILFPEIGTSYDIERKKSDPDRAKVTVNIKVDFAAMYKKEFEKFVFCDKYVRLFDKKFMCPWTTDRDYFLYADYEDFYETYVNPLVKEQNADKVYNEGFVCEVRGEIDKNTVVVTKSLADGVITVTFDYFIFAYNFEDNSKLHIKFKPSAIDLV